MTAYKRPVFFDRDIKSFSELSADSGLDLGIVARSILADAALQVGGSTTGTLLVKNASDQSVASIEAFANYADFKLTKTDGTPLNVMSAGDYQAFNTSGQYRTYLGPGRLDLKGTDTNTRAMLDTYDGYGVLTLNESSGSTVLTQSALTDFGGKIAFRDSGNTNPDGAVENKILLDATQQKIAMLSMNTWSSGPAVGFVSYDTNYDTSTKAKGYAQFLYTEGEFPGGAQDYIRINEYDGEITGLLTPTQPSSAANKAYVDSVAQGLAPKGACHVSSQGNLADLATTTEVDGHTLSVGERVLVRYQSNAVENGIYEFDGTGLVRTADMAAGSHAAGAFTFVQFGTNADQGWVCTADAPTDVVGTDALPWTQFSAAGVIEAGDGLQLIGTVLSAKLDGTTLAASVDGLKVLGLPVEFEIDGVAVSPDFTATSIAALVGGAASNASEWHMHQSDVLYLGADAALSAGQACIVASGQAAPAGTTSTGAYAIGVAESIAGGMARVVRSGLAFNVITGATSGEPVYVQADGTLGTLLPTSGRVVMLGIATNTTDVFVQVRDFGSILAA